MVAVQPLLAKQIDLANNYYIMHSNFKTRLRRETRLNVNLRRGIFGVFDEIDEHLRSVFYSIFFI